MVPFDIHSCWHEFLYIFIFLLFFLYLATICSALLFHFAAIPIQQLFTFKSIRLRDAKFISIQWLDSWNFALRKQCFAVMIVNWIAAHNENIFVCTEFIWIKIILQLFNIFGKFRPTIEIFTLLFIIHSIDLVLKLDRQVIKRIHIKRMTAVFILFASITCPLTQISPILFRWHQLCSLLSFWKMYYYRLKFGWHSFETWSNEKRLHHKTFQFD